MIYINKDIEGYYFESEEYLERGLTYTDFLNGKNIRLSDDQVVYHNDFPDASIKELMDVYKYENGNITWFTQKAPVTLESVKQKKLGQLSAYDNSDAVNSFTIGDESMWLTPQQRQQVSMQIQANEDLGREEMTKWFNGKQFTFTLFKWRQMLSSLEVYAGDALNATEMHKANINNLNTIEDIQNYDYTVGYPEKLVFAV
jgi:hypothetical protein